MENNIKITIILPGSQSISITWKNQAGHNTSISGYWGETTTSTTSPDHAVREALQMFTGTR